MSLKQSAVALCSSGLRCGIGPQCHSSRLPSSSPGRRYHKHQRGHDCRRSRHSADEGSDRPIPWPKCSRPTPYEILNLSKTEPYTKARFFELVKLYHPDRHRHTSHHPISRATKLERYRLVVLANTILSDPERRQRYDLYGAGWDGKPDMLNLRTHHSNGKSWREQAGSAAYNATWEDWEEWHRRQNGTASQGPVFMSNGLFAAIILATAAVGAIGQFTWANSHARHIAMLKEEHHKELVELMKQHHDHDFLTEGESKIQAFVQKKEGLYYVPPSKR